MISGWIILRMRNISNIVEKIKTHFVYNSYFPKYSFYKVVWNNMVESERPQKAMLYGACAWRAGCIMLYFEPLTSFFSSFMPII